MSDYEITEYTAHEGGRWYLWSPTVFPPPEKVLYDKSGEFADCNFPMLWGPSHSQKKFWDAKVICACYPQSCLTMGLHYSDAVDEGAYKKIWVHALRFSDGREWDAVNGWRYKWPN